MNLYTCVLVSDQQTPLEEYDEEENREFQLNSRAIYILVCVMDRTE